MSTKQDPDLVSDELNASASDPESSEPSASTRDKQESASSAGSELEQECVDNPREVTELEVAESEEDINTLRVEIVSLQSALSTTKEQILRAHAETENVRRRMLRDVEKAERYALDTFAEALLPTLDAFEQALQTDGSQDTDRSVLQGIELSVRKLYDTLAKFGIESFDPQGEVFDPSKHKAMTEVAHPDSEPGTVLEVFRKGFMIHERLLRAAEVVVSK